MGTLFTFKRPRLAWTALAIAVFSIFLAFYPEPSIEKFGYMLAMGFGSGFLVHGAKAMAADFSNLGLLLAILGLTMLIASVLGTPSAIFTANMLEEEATLIIGSGLGFFAKIDEG